MPRFASRDSWFHGIRFLRHGFVHLIVLRPLNSDGTELIFWNLYENKNIWHVTPTLVLCRETVRPTDSAAKGDHFLVLTKGLLATWCLAAKHSQAEPKSEADGAMPSAATAAVPKKHQAIAGIWSESSLCLECILL